MSPWLGSMGLRWRNGGRDARMRMSPLGRLEGGNDECPRFVVLGNNRVGKFHEAIAMPCIRSQGLYLFSIRFSEVLLFGCTGTAIPAVEIKPERA